MAEIAIVYPLIETESGDLAITLETRSKAVDRARLLIDVRPGERVLVPEFGSNVGLFEPTDDTSEAEAALLQYQINYWCNPIETTTVNYTVATLRSERSDVIELEVQIDGI